MQFQEKFAIVYPLAFGEVGVKQRVKSIINYKKHIFVAMFFSFLAFAVIVISFLATSPQEYQITDASLTQTQRHVKENKLEQILLDYDKDNIVEASVFLQYIDNAVTSANILVVSKEEIMNVDEQNKMKVFVSDYLNLDADKINLEYVDSRTFF